MTLLRTSFLNPITMATERIMTVNPNAMPVIAMRMAGGVTFRPSSEPKLILLAKKSSRFMIDVAASNGLR